MHRDSSPVRDRANAQEKADNEFLLVEKAARTQAKIARLNNEIKQMFLASEKAGYSRASLDAFRKAVETWTLKSQRAFFIQVFMYCGPPRTPIAHIERIVAGSPQPFLGVLATLLAEVDTGNSQARKFFRDLASSLSLKEREEVWTRYTDREFQYVEYYIPWFEIRLNLLLPKPLRGVCTFKQSFRAFWLELPDTDDFTHKLRLCSRWYLHKALALDPEDRIYKDIVQRGRLLAKKLKKDPEYETLRAQLIATEPTTQEKLE